MLRKLRIGVLVYVLVLVAGGTWLTRVRSTDWSEPLWVTVYPINGDGGAGTARYVSALDRETFVPVEAFFQAEAERHAVALERPFVVNLSVPLAQAPPGPPAGRNPLAVMLWSLRLRFWAWRVEWSQSAPGADIQMFVVYHDPEARAVLPHSLGLQKGLIGVVHAFASRRMAPTNNVVIAHELLHTLGASDKYDPATSYPRHPEGFADPGRSPRFPQTHAELMGGRIPLDPRRAAVPRSLERVSIGPRTAAEIRWREVE